MSAGYAAQIQLQSVFPENDPAARQKRLSAARAVMSVVHGVEDVDPRLLHVFLGLMWTPVYEVLGLEKRRLQEASDTRNSIHMQQEMDVLLCTMKRIGRVFPQFMALHIERFQK
ncbi:hypothetical protein BOTBODRAFT_193353 [Botryobasidium botryosum FD-172 SS1]|uniref:Uncharacterized protein n=1 Tax=Botryobasidium botryosum (strain FD-172 SS1) TaxID=930990 RepID=A0A067NAH4_BOTB1|nr:hypothetical protein BOTBODRAFT_193353 [Botryobasidium botryosum FD-172 SS1]